MSLLAHHRWFQRAVAIAVTAFGFYAVALSTKPAEAQFVSVPAGVVVNGGWGWAAHVGGCGPFFHDGRSFHDGCFSVHDGRFFVLDGRFFNDGRFFHDRRFFSWWPLSPRRLWRPRFCPRRLWRPRFCPRRLYGRPALMSGVGALRRLS